MKDEGVPKLAELDAVISWMDQQITKGERVLVHCRYGIGRTGIIVLAYLMHSGLEFKEARKMMKKTPAWPSTRKQRDLLDTYIQKTRKVSVQDHLSGTVRTSVNRYFERIKSAMKWDD